MRILLGLTALLLCEVVSAQAVSLSGSLGYKALLMIDGVPYTVHVGATVRGVKLVSLGDNAAIIEMSGFRVPLALGAAQVNLGGSNSAGGGSRIVLTASSGGHFLTSGAINGKTVEFMVDTGATAVSISQTDADRIGLKYRDGKRELANTANGQISVHRITLGNVRVGDVQIYNVDAVVIPAQLNHVLLGNSFLSRFQLKRENDVLTLDRKP